MHRTLSTPNRIKEALPEIHHHSPDPPPRKRHIIKHRLHRLTDRRILPLNHPIRCPLKDGQRFGDFRNLRNDLRGCCSVPNDSYSFVADVVIPIPAGGMDDFPFEVAQPLDIRVLGYVQLPDSRNKKIGSDGVLAAEFGIFATQSRDFRLPGLGRGIPACFLDRGREADVFVELVFLRDVDEVIVDLFLTRVEARPIWIGLE
jgi:hypothetical protein